MQQSLNNTVLAGIANMKINSSKNLAYLDSNIKMINQQIPIIFNDKDNLSKINGFLNSILTSESLKNLQEKILEENQSLKTNDSNPYDENAVVVQDSTVKKNEETKSFKIFYNGNIRYYLY